MNTAKVRAGRQCAGVLRGVRLCHWFWLSDALGGTYGAAVACTMCIDTGADRGIGVCTLAVADLKRR
jgi:hypothetical protein